MRIEPIIAWIFVGAGLLFIGTLLDQPEANGELGKFLAAMGIMYFGIGIVLSVVHDRYMDTRTRAGRRRE